VFLRGTIAVPRTFISHSSVDNVAVLAFQRWLIAKGWDQEDVFIDLHGIGAGSFPSCSHICP
jgi:hypothetical protein